MNTNFAGSMVKDKEGRTLVAVTFGDGRTTIFNTPANIPVDRLHALTLAYNPKKHRGADYIMRMQFIDPIAQSPNANDAPVRIETRYDPTEVMRCVYFIHGVIENGTVLNLWEDHPAVPSGRCDTGGE